MAMVVRKGEAGVTDRKRPDRAAPIAGVRVDVSALVVRGLRSRNGAEDDSSREARRRTKNRWRSRWKRRMSEKDAATRALEPFGGGGVVALVVPVSERIA